MPTEYPHLHALHSWKEIANYLGRGVRTVQRWQKLGLPVRRLGTGSRSPVMADARDLDRWLQRASSNRSKIPQSSDHLMAIGMLRDVLQQGQCLRDEMAALRDSTSSSLARLVLTLSNLEKAYTESRSGLETPDMNPSTPSARSFAARGRRN